MKKRWLSRLSLSLALCLLFTAVGGSAASAGDTFVRTKENFAPVQETPAAVAVAEAAPPESAVPIPPAPILPDTIPMMETGSGASAEADTALPETAADLPAQDAPVLPDAAPAEEAATETALPAEDGAVTETSAAEAQPAAADGETAEAPADIAAEPAAEEPSAAPLAEVEALFHVGGDFASELTAEHGEVLARLQVERSAWVALTGEGTAVRVTVKHEFSGAEQTFLPERTDEGWQPLNAVFQAQAGSYLVTVQAAETGAAGSFRIFAKEAEEPKEAEAPADEPAEENTENNTENSAEESADQNTDEETETPAAVADDAGTDAALPAEDPTEAPAEEPAAEDIPEPDRQPSETDQTDGDAPSDDGSAIGGEDTDGDAATEIAIVIGGDSASETPASPEAGADADASDEADGADVPEAAGEELPGGGEDGPETGTPGEIPPEPSTEDVRPGGGDAEEGTESEDGAAVSRGVPMVLASANTVATGSPVTFTVSGLAAAIYNFYLYAVPVGGSVATLFGSTSGPVNSFSAIMPVTDQDVYCVVNCLTSAGWVQLVSGWVHVRSVGAPLSISVSSSASSVEVGHQVTFTVNQLSGGPIAFYHYIIIDGANNQLYAASSSSNTFTYTAPSGVTNIICLAYAYSGTFVAAYSPWVAVTPSTALAIKCWVDVTAISAGAPLTIHTQQLSGNPIVYYRYMLYDGTTIIHTVNATTPDLTLVTPNVSGTLYAYVLAWDGATWASAMSGGFTVTPAAPLAITVVPSALSVRAGETMWFTVNQTSGGTITYYRYIISDQSANQLAVFDTSSSFQVFTPPSGVTHILCTVMAFDGGWVTAQSVWVSVTSPTYRALLIGQTYSGTSLQLSGPENDSKGMASMLATMNATPYTVTRKTNLTRSGILSAISSAFAGASNGDVSLLYYAGHAVTNTAALIGSDLATLTPAQLRQALDQIPGKKIVIFDACYSGAQIGRGLSDGDILVESAESGSGDEDSQATASALASAFLGAFRGANAAAGGATSRSADNLADAGYYVICSAHSTQESWESGGYGWFTQTLTLGSGYNERTSAVTGLAADSNGDKFISLSEIFSYCQHHYDGYTVDAFGKTVYFNTQCYPAGSSQKFYGRQ